MQTLKNNKAIGQLRTLLSSAITLKEQFDTKQSPEILIKFLEIYLRDLEALHKICPSEVFSKGKLLQHASFLERYLRQMQPDNCYGDIREICFTDIFEAEESYLQYLSDTSSISERYFDWQSIHLIIQRIAKSRFENHHFADAVEASFKEINDIIKKAYSEKIGKEEDGVSLMQKAFSPNNNSPNFHLADDLSSESGKNIQLGYMQIFAGAM